MSVVQFLGFLLQVIVPHFNDVNVDQFVLLRLLCEGGHTLLGNDAPALLFDEDRVEGKQEHLGLLAVQKLTPVLVPQELLPELFGRQQALQHDLAVVHQMAALLPVYLQRRFLRHEIRPQQGRGHLLLQRSKHVAQLGMQNVMRIVPVHTRNLPYWMDELLQALHNYSAFLLLLVNISDFTQQIVLGYSLEVRE